MSARGRVLLLALFALVLAVGAAPAQALPSCSDHFIGPSGGDWATAANWDAGVPGSGDVACWSAGVTVVVSTGTQGAESIQGGDLEITGGLLELFGPDDSTLVNFSETGGQTTGNCASGCAPTNNYSLKLSGTFAWSGGQIGYTNGAQYTPLNISQTGGGSFAISGTAAATLNDSSTIKTTSPVNISNLSFGGVNSSLTTTSTVTLAPGTHVAGSGVEAQEGVFGAFQLVAAGVITSGTTTLSDAALGLTGTSTSLGGSLEVTDEFDMSSTSSVTVPTGITLATRGGTVSGSIDGLGEFEQYVPSGKGAGTTTFAAGSKLATSSMLLTGGTFLTIDPSATYDVPGSTTLQTGDDQLTLGPSSAATGDLNLAGVINGAGSLHVSGHFAMTGGGVRVPVSQTGGGSFAITGTAGAAIGAPVTTTSAPTISNLTLVGTGNASITSTGALTLAPGTYRQGGLAPLRLNAPGLITSGATTIPDFSLHLEGNSSSLGGSLTTPVLSTDAATTLTVPSGDTLTSDGGEIAGTLTGPGAFTQGTGTTFVANGGALSVHKVTIPQGTLELDAGSAYAAATATTVDGGTLDLRSTGATTGGYSETDSGTTRIAASGPSPGQYASLTVAGPVKLDGTLVIAPTSAYASSAARGDTLQVLHYSGTRAGNFAQTLTDPAATKGSFVADASHPNVIDAVLEAPAITALEVAPRKFTLSGRRVNGRCVARAKKANATSKRCHRRLDITAGFTLNRAARVTITLRGAGRTLTTTAFGQRGANTITLPWKHLRAATYSLIVTTSGGAARRTRFTIKR